MPMYSNYIIGPYNYNKCMHVCAYNLCIIHRPQSAGKFPSVIEILDEDQLM